MQTCNLDSDRLIL